MPTSIARGRWQREIWHAMTTTGACNPVSELKGRARQYSMRYDASFGALCARAKRAGYTIVVTPGPRGGKHKAVFQAIPA